MHERFQIRVYVPHLKKMFEVRWICGMRGGTASMLTKEGRIMTLDEKQFIPMQCLGKKDSKDALIYEGDICIDVENPGQERIVKWDEGFGTSFKLYPETICRSFEELLERGRLLVVGNIYEEREEAST